MKDAQGLRVATFNIRNGRAFDRANSWPFRRGATLATLRQLDADVIGLQEVYGFQLRWLLRHLPGYVAVGDGRNGEGRGERSPLLVRRSAAAVLKADTHWYGGYGPGSRLAGARFPRIATVAYLAVEPAGPTVQVVNTHLDEASAPNRLSSAEELVTLIDSQVPHLVLGDLNARPGSPVLATLLDARLEAATPAGGAGTAHRFRGGTDGPQLDHILVSRHWRIDGCTVATRRTGSRLPSDHWPLVADLSLSRT